MNQLREDVHAAWAKRRLTNRSSHVKTFIGGTVPGMFRVADFLAAPSVVVFS